jgi:hypothetical protein
VKNLLPGGVLMVLLATGLLAGAQEPAGPKGKAAGHTTNPVLLEAIDLPLKTSYRVVWAPTGDQLGVVTVTESVSVPAPAPKAFGTVRDPQDRGPGVDGPPFTAKGSRVADGDGGGPATVPVAQTLFLVNTRDLAAPQPVGPVQLPSPQVFVGFTPDGRHLATAQREHRLVSGKHRVSLWAVGDAPAAGGPGGAAVSLKPHKAFGIDPGQSDDYVFDADGQSYRTLKLTRDDAVIRKVFVQRVSAETGKVVETVGAFGGTFHTAQLTPDGKRLVTIDTQTEAVETHDLGDGKNWSVVPNLELVRATARGRTAPVGLSRDGSRVVVARGFGRLALIDGTAGAVRTALDGAELVDVNAASATFSADSRLVAVPYHRVEKTLTQRGGFGGGGPGGGGFGGPKGAEPPPITSYSSGEARLGVWDTTTGKLLHSWPGQVTAVAFHPTRPVLAVLEPNRAQTRLGLWDFSAD